MSTRSAGHWLIRITRPPSDSPAPRKIHLRLRVLETDEFDSVGFLAENYNFIADESRVIDAQTGDQSENCYASVIREIIDSGLSRLRTSPPPRRLHNTTFWRFEPESDSPAESNIPSVLADFQVDLIFVLVRNPVYDDLIQPEAPDTSSSTSTTTTNTGDVVIGNYEDVRGKFDEDEKCSICLKNFSDGTGNEAAKLPCSHVFHSDCVLRWLEQKCSCPLCRFDVLSLSRT